MKFWYLSLSMALIGCGVEVSRPTSPIKKSDDAKAPAEVETGNQGSKSEVQPAKTPKTDVPKSESSSGGETNPEREAEGETGAAFVVDPETLSFPVVFHLSDAWESEESLLPVVAEVQRILAQAKIEILPRYTEDDGATDFLDVTYVPSVPDNPDVNGISFGGRDLEVFVRDKVGLGRVDDKRPPEAPSVRTLKGAVPGASIKVSASEAAQARTTAHEICHQLSLPHRQDSTNLMASGTTGWTLNEAEIKAVRNTAAKKFRAKFVEVFQNE